MIIALKLLRTAKANGWSFKVVAGDDEIDYQGTSPSAAWEAVKATDEAHVVFYAADGQRLGVAHLMAPGVNTCDPAETLVNYSVKAENPFTQLCDDLIAEAV